MEVLCCFKNRGTDNEATVQWAEQVQFFKFISCP